MEQLPSDKYNVAWFKLAECVSRGERERAFGVYRLLMHSIEDAAFAKQLEGDLLWFFGDDGAVDCYSTALTLYQESEKLVEAAAICEHLVALRPNEHIYREHLIQLYRNLGVTSKMGHGIEQFVALLLFNKQSHKIDSLLTTFDEFHEPHAYAVAHGAVVKVLINSHIGTDEQIRLYLKKAIESFILSGNSVALTSFMSALRALHEPYYEVAAEYIAQDSF